MNPQELFAYFGLNMPYELAWITFALLAIWSVSWKGIALWRAARKDHLTWFVVLLIVNTLGILDIIYIYLVSDRKNP